VGSQSCVASSGTSYVGLVDLDLPGEGRSLRRDHCPAQLVEQHPSCLAPLEPELALQLESEIPGVPVLVW
jgi:hypothetical protein